MKVLTDNDIEALELDELSIQGNKDKPQSIWSVHSLRESSRGDVEIQGKNNEHLAST